MLSSKQLQSRTSTRIHQTGLYCVALCCTQFCVKPDGSQLLNQEKATDKPLTSKYFGRARFPIALPIFLGFKRRRLEKEMHWDNKEMQGRVPLQASTGP